MLRVEARTRLLERVRTAAVNVCSLYADEDESNDTHADLRAALGELDDYDSQRVTLEQPATGTRLGSGR